MSQASSIAPLAYIIFASPSVIHTPHLPTNRQYGLSSYIHPRSLSRPYHRLKRSDHITFSYLGTNVGNTNSRGYLIPWLIPLTLDDDSLLRVGSCVSPSDGGSGEVQGVSPNLVRRKANNKVPSSCVVVEVLIEILLPSIFPILKRSH